jgi:hypothetical protein
VPRRPHLSRLRTSAYRRRPVRTDAGAVPRPPVLLAAVVSGLLLGACGVGTVDVGAEQPPEDDRDACRLLLNALPTRVADQPGREIEPQDGWGAAWGDPAIVLRCGVSPPEGFDAVATCTTVEGIDWYVPDSEPEEYADVTMWTVHREPVVEVLLPAEHWPPAAMLVDVAGTVREHTERTGRCY